MIFDQVVFIQPGFENYLVFLITHCLIIYLFEHPHLERQNKKLTAVAASSAATATLPEHSTVRLDKQGSLLFKFMFWMALNRPHGKQNGATKAKMKGGVRVLS